MGRRGGGTRGRFLLHPRMTLRQEGFLGSEDIGEPRSLACPAPAAFRALAAGRVEGDSGDLPAPDPPCLVEGPKEPPLIERLDPAVSCDPGWDVFHAPSLHVLPGHLPEAHRVGCYPEAIGRVDSGGGSPGGADNGEVGFAVEYFVNDPVDTEDIRVYLHIRIGRHTPALVGGTGPDTFIEEPPPFMGIVAEKEGQLLPDLPSLGTPPEVIRDLFCDCIRGIFRRSGSLPDIKTDRAYRGKYHR